mgnify:CR=1 FL=1
MSSRRSQGEQFGLCSARLSACSGKPGAEAPDLSRVMARSDSIPRRSRRREAFGVYPDHFAQPSGADTVRMLRKMGSLGTAATDLALTWRSPVCDGHCGESIAFRRDDSRSPERSHRKRFGLRAVARKFMNGGFRPPIRNWTLASEPLVLVLPLDRFASIATCHPEPPWPDASASVSVFQQTPLPFWQPPASEAPCHGEGMSGCRRYSNPLRHS